MRILTLVALAPLAFVSAGGTREKEPPPGEPPALWRASASQRDGKVVIQIAADKGIRNEPKRLGRVCHENSGTSKERQGHPGQDRQNLF